MVLRRERISILIRSPILLKALPVRGRWATLAVVPRSVLEFWKSLKASEHLDPFSLEKNRMVRPSKKVPDEFLDAVCLDLRLKLFAPCSFTTHLRVLRFTRSTNKKVYQFRNSMNSTTIYFLFS